MYCNIIALDLFSKKAKEAESTMALADDIAEENTKDALSYHGIR